MACAASRWRGTAKNSFEPNDTSACANAISNCGMNEGVAQMAIKISGAAE